MKNVEVTKILRKLSRIESLVRGGKEVKLSDYISEHEAKKVFNKGSTWFWNQRQLGLPYHKIGSEVYFLRSDLLEFIKKNKKGGQNND